MINTIPDYLINAYINSPENIVLLNKDFKVLWLNKSFTHFLESIHNKDANNLINGDLRNLLTEYLHEDELIINQMISGLQSLYGDKSKCFTYEFPLYTATSSHWMLLTACYQELKETALFTLKIYDISNQHKQRKLENKKDDNEIVRQIITESMHTWRQPLNSISLFTQDLQEQFGDNSLTKYYMNFATRQIFNEIKRLSDSLDEMAAFYSNNSDEEIINVAETMFSSIETLDDILKESEIMVKLNCHALGDIKTETFISITDNFDVRCGTGTKKCFHGCNKGNVVLTGDKSLYQFIIRHLITLGIQNITLKPSDIHFEHLIKGNKLIVRIRYQNISEKVKTDIELIKQMLKNNFNADLEFSFRENALTVNIIFTDYKSKNPI